MLRGTQHWKPLRPIVPRCQFFGHITQTSPNKIRVAHHFYMTDFLGKTNKPSLEMLHNFFLALEITFTIISWKKMLFTENNGISSEKLNIFSGCIFGQMWQKYRGKPGLPSLMSVLWSGRRQLYHTNPQKNDLCSYRQQVNFNYN